MQETGTQALARGLRILRQLVEAERPLSATEIGRQCGLHQSSVSRILAALVNEGYVTKAGRSGFVPDYGILAVAVTAQSRFAVMDKPRRILQDAAEKCAGLTVTLCMLWHDQMIYFLRSSVDRAPVLFEGGGYPMHLSSPALRFVADMSDADAVALLNRSRERFGWERPTERIPGNVKNVVKVARSMVEHDCLVLADWEAVGHVSAAIKLRPLDGHPLALALYGPTTVASEDELRVLLHEIRRDVELTLAMR